jgi:hypothetical protein
MGTRSRIGLELSDGSILSVYCHYDGYPEFNGVKLIEHFNSYDKAVELIDGGDISSLWTNESFRDASGATKSQECGPLYYSERGEDCPPRLDATFGKYLGDNEEYAYLFSNGKWVCYNNRRWDDKFLQQVEIPVAVAA